MAEVGRRFELSGRAADAQRFDLAAFEVGEIEELFDEDLARAELPKEGPSTSLPPLADGFRKGNLPELETAASSHDRAAYASAFRRASLACNGCHQASGHGFVVIPPEFNRSIPDVSPASTPVP